MKGCLRCELTRARLIAAGLLLVGTSPHIVVARLNGPQGESYYLKGDAIWRRNNPTDIRILPL